MEEPIEPTKVRQGQRGLPVLLILAVSLALTAVVAWFLWVAFNDSEGSRFMRTEVVTPSPRLALFDVLDVSSPLA